MAAVPLRAVFRSDFVTLLVLVDDKDTMEELASSTYTRRRWEEDAVWQPLREAVEKMLIAYDWGEAFVALNLTVKPVFDDVFNAQLAELARAHEDALLALMLDDFALDNQCSRDWSVALVQYATAQRPANADFVQAMDRAVEAPGLSGNGRGSRAVRASAASAGTTCCFGKSADRTPRLLGSVWA